MADNHSRNCHEKSNDGSDHFQINDHLLGRDDKKI